jgi:hypothetical protein
MYLDTQETLDAPLPTISRRPGMYHCTSLLAKHFTSPISSTASIMIYGTAYRLLVHFCFPFQLDGPW